MSTPLKALLQERLRAKIVRHGPEAGETDAVYVDDEEEYVMLTERNDNNEVSGIGSVGGMGGVHTPRHRHHATPPKQRYGGRVSPLVPPVRHRPQHPHQPNPNHRFLGSFSRQTHIEDNNNNYSHNHSHSGNSPSATTMSMPHPLYTLPALTAHLPPPSPSPTPPRQSPSFRYHSIDDQMQQRDVASNQERFGTWRQSDDPSAAVWNTTTSHRIPPMASLGSFRREASPPVDFAASSASIPRSLPPLTPSRIDSVQPLLPPELYIPFAKQTSTFPSPLDMNLIEKPYQSGRKRPIAPEDEDVEEQDQQHQQHQQSSADALLSPNSRSAAKAFVEKRQRRVPEKTTPRTRATQRWLQSHEAPANNDDDDGEDADDAASNWTVSPLSSTMSSARSFIY